MKTNRGVIFFLFGLLTAPFLPSLAGTLNAQDLSQFQDSRFSYTPFALVAENNAKESSSNLTQLNDRSKANFILNWGEYLYPELS